MLDNKNDGFVLPAVIIFIVFSIIMGMAILELGTMEKVRAIRRGNREAAFYLAEAGIQKGIAAFLEDGESAEFLSQNSRGPYILDEIGEIQVRYIPHEQAIISTGRVGSSHNPIEETIKVYFLSGSSGNRIFGQGLFTDAHFDLAGGEIRGYDSRDGTKTAAMLSSNQDIEIRWGGKIYGNVAAGGNLTYPQQHDSWGNKEDFITGDIMEHEPHVFPDVEIPNMNYTTVGLSGNFQTDIDENFYIRNWPREATIHSGDYRFNDFEMTNDGVLTIDGEVRLHFTGDFSMTGDTQIVLTENSTLQIYMGPENGDFYLGNSSRINPGGTPGDVAVYSASDGEVKLTGNAPANMVVYAPHAHVELTGSSPLRGSAVSSSMKMSGDTTVYYDTALKETQVTGASGLDNNVIRIKEWTRASRLE